VTDSRLTLVNAAAFQACWFACVIGGSLWALPAVILFMVWHQRVADKREWILISVLTLCGIAIDTLWYQIGLIQFPNYSMPVVPVWLALLWLAFSATLMHSLAVFFSRPWLITPVAAIAAPVSYFAGERFGSITLADNSLWVIAASWAGLMLVFSVAHKNLTKERVYG
jgi:hypothetical protein